jgi:hypothetical protein
MSKLDKDQVIAAFSEAYTAVNGKAPSIEAKSGWYSVDGGKNIRLAELDAMTTELGSTAPSKEANAVVDNAKKVTEKKPVTVTETSKSAVKKKVKKSDFSVKAFWTHKILEISRQSKLPR